MAIRFLNSQSIDGELTVTGNVGIGTTSPNSRLEVSDTFPVLRLTNESSTSTIGDVVSSIEFYNSDTSGNYPAVGAAIKSINESAFGNANALGFFTNSDSASESEHMRINSSGNVGIGTTSPLLSYGGKGLQIQNTDTAGLRLTDTTGADFDISARSGDVLLYEGEGNPIRIGVGGSEKMRIQNDGYVGIGTTTPGYLLDVQAVTDPSIRVRSSGTGSSDDALVRIRVGGTTASSIVAFGDSSSSTRGQIKYTHSVDAMRLYTAGAEQVRIDSNGDVGIGSTNPIAKLYVDGGILGGTAGDEVALLSLKTTNNNTDTLQFTSERLTTGTDWTHAAQRIQRKIDTTLMGYMQFGSMNDDLITFGEGNTERMRIDGDGNVGIGNASPENILHVEKANPIIFVQDTDTSLSTTEAYIKFSGSQSSAAGGGFRTDVEKAIGYKEDSLVFEDGGTERMRIDSSGNVGIGTDDPSSRLEVSDSDPTIRLTNSTVSLGNGTVGSFEFFTEDSSTNASRVLSSIDCENAAGSSIPGGELVFKTSLGGGSFTQATEKMRLDDVGNLGIGTDDPDALLHISQGANSTATNLIIENTDTSIVDTEDLAKIEFKSNDISTEGVGVAASIRTVAESAGNRFGIAFNTKNLSAETEKMRIAYTGNVGIGFTVPADKLEVGGAISASAGYGFKLANSTETAIGKWYSASGVNYLEGDGTRSFQIGSSTNGVNVKFDNVNNRVGIGNESPDATLAIGDSTSTGNYIKVEGSSSDNTYTVFEGKRKYPKIRLEDTIGSAFELWNLGNTLRFGTSVGNAGSAAWYTKSGVAGDVIFNGDVGIGTSSPGSKLEVNGSVEFNQDGDVMFYAGDGSSNFNWGIGDFDQAGGGASIKNNVGEVEVHTDGSIAATFTDDNRISGVADPTGDQDVSTKKYVDDLKVAISIAVSDEETDLAVGTSNVTFRMPYAMTLTEVRASLNRAPGGSTLIVDINETASTILSTKLSIDIGEKTSTTAATAAVISDTALADDAEITIDIDQIGSSDAGKGLKVTLIGTRT